MYRRFPPGLLFSIACIHAVQCKELYAYLGTTPVLDGRIDPKEWADATMERGIANWDPEFEPVHPSTPPVDLDLTLWLKHDRTHLYFAFEITDDVLYGFQTPAWLPSGNPSANNLTQEVRFRHCSLWRRAAICLDAMLRTCRDGRGLVTKWSYC